MNIPENFYRSEQSAVSSETWIGPKEVLQRRDAKMFSAWDARMKILQSISDPEQMLVAADCQYWLEDDALWVLYQRRDLPNSPALVELTAQETENSFRDYLNDILATEELLRSVAVSQDLLTLGWQEASKTHLARTIDDRRVRDTLVRLGYLVHCPLPPETPLVLSHGDVIPKNVILTRWGYRLIDWETLGLYPASATLAHALSWMLLHIPEDRWDNFLKDVLPSCLLQMQLQEEEVLFAIYWQMAREALLWACDPDRFLLWIKQAERFYDTFN